MQTNIIIIILGADYSPLRTATNSMLTYINHVQCSGEELNILDCSYSRNHTDNDHSKDLGIQCKKGKLHATNMHCLKRDYEVVREL